MAFFRKKMLELAYLAACGSNPISGSYKYPVNSSEWRETQIEKLKRIVDYAMVSSSFYKSHYVNFLKGVPVKDMPSDEFMNVFQQLPYLEKEHIRGDHVNQLKVPGIRGYLRKTSGSTGIPVRVYLDKFTLAQQLKTRWMFFAWHGINPGDVEGRFWGRPSNRQFRDVVKDFLLCRELFQFDGDDSILLKSMKRMEDSTLKYFYGYPSILMKYAEAYDGSKRKRPQPKVIFSTAEILNEAQRGYLSDIFNCPVYQEYGCSEVDIIAFECKYKKYHLNTNRVFIDYCNTEEEELDIHITDYDNRCTPLIKYRINDSVKITYNKCDCNKSFGYISNVIGRTSDRIVQLPGGKKIHSVEFSYLFNQLIDNGVTINNYQILHTSPNEMVIKIDMDTDEFNKLMIDINNRFNKIFNNTVKFKFLLGKIQNQTKKTYYVKEF